jgi:NADPH:quinone reductase-like Zn-dependent oxidoreductase
MNIENSPSFHHHPRHRKGKIMIGSHLEAASVTLVGGTVWEALVTRAQLAGHETVLIHGGAGGVGTIAIQLAKAMDARVITTARRNNHDFCVRSGLTR